MTEFLDALYARLPISMQNLACSAYGWREKRARLGKRFWMHLAELEESQHWRAEAISGFQDEQVRRVVAHAFEHVPHYRAIMRAHRLHPMDIRGVADLPKLPILTKDELRASPMRFLADNARKRGLANLHTSGTTGKSLSFFLESSALAFRWAVWWRHRMRFGVRPGERHMNFTGKRVVPLAQSRPPYWRLNRPMNQVLVNMHHMVPDKVPRIVDYLNAEPVAFFSGYPSVIHAFARAALTAGARLTAPPGFVFTGAENILEFQRADIARVTQATISDQYGFSEGAGNASQCPALVYHEDFEYGVLECVDPVPGDEPGSVKGRIIATGFASSAFPFIRYDVGDIGVWAAPTHRCRCGRESAVLLRIEGRVDDYVITPEGRRIMRFDYLFKGTDHVRECQVVQREQGSIVLRIVREPAYSVTDELELRRLVAGWISPNLGVSFEYVPEIPRGANGKFRAVRSELRSTV